MVVVVIVIIESLRPWWLCRAFSSQAARGPSAVLVVSVAAMVVATCIFGRGKSMRRVTFLLHLHPHSRHRHRCHCHLSMSSSFSEADPSDLADFALLLAASPSSSVTSSSSAPDPIASSFSLSLPSRVTLAVRSIRAEPWHLEHKRTVINLLRGEPHEVAGSAELFVRQEPLQECRVARVHRCQHQTWHCWRSPDLKLQGGQHTARSCQ